ncbi:hypothetical protein BVRB_8g184560 [Beta vulgaris subsp. vulgaris]|nr:hypothetical protein BVRB_8g184560 [Beta vulgaris subsp. vulgaris]
MVAADATTALGVVGEAGLQPLLPPRHTAAGFLPLHCIAVAGFRLVLHNRRTFISIALPSPVSG